MLEDWNTNSAENDAYKICANSTCRFELGSSNCRDEKLVEFAVKIIGY